jgi:hypothetical protein
MSPLESATSQTFADTPALHGVSFGVDEGEIICLLAGLWQDDAAASSPGLETPDAGQVLFLGSRPDLCPIAAISADVPGLRPFPSQKRV